MFTQDGPNEGRSLFCLKGWLMSNDSAAEVLSVVIAQEDGRVKKAYASRDAAVIIATQNALRANFSAEQISVFTCEVIDAAPKVRKSRAKGEPKNG